MRILKRKKVREQGKNNIIIIGVTCDTRAVTRIPPLSHQHPPRWKKTFRTRLSLFWRHSPEDWGKPHSVFQILDVGESETKKRRKRVGKKDARRTRQVAVNVPREPLIKINGSTEKRDRVLRALATSEIKKLLDAV